MITILEKINHINFLIEYKKIENNIIWLENNNGKQCGLQYSLNEDYFLSATGKLKHDRSEEEYNILNPLFEDTIFDDIIKKYKLFRSRLMWSYPKSCYSLHKDQTKRIHIPIITNKDCYFLFPDVKLFHLSTGFLYQVDTTNIHSFCNFSNNSRLHFIGCTRE